MSETASKHRLFCTLMCFKAFCGCFAENIILNATLMENKYLVVSLSHKHCHVLVENSDPIEKCSHTAYNSVSFYVQLYVILIELASQLLIFI